MPAAACGGARLRLFAGVGESADEPMREALRRGNRRAITGGAVWGGRLRMSGDEPEVLPLLASIVFGVTAAPGAGR